MIREVIHRSGEQGQSLSEMAISLTFILVLLAGVVDIGRAFFTYISLRDAAQEGALYASYQPNDCNGIIYRVKDTSNKPFDLSSASVSIEVLKGSAWTQCSVATPVAGDPIRVTASKNDFQISMPFLGTLIGKQTVSISASIKDTILSVPTPAP